VARGSLDVVVAVTEGYEGLRSAPVKRVVFVCRRDCRCMCMQC